jgi:hypothetical protein
MRSVAQRAQNDNDDHITAVMKALERAVAASSDSSLPSANERRLP